MTFEDILVNRVYILVPTNRQRFGNILDIKQREKSRKTKENIPHLKKESKANLKAVDIILNLTLEFREKIMGSLNIHKTVMESSYQQEIGCTENKLNTRRKMTIF